MTVKRISGLLYLVFWQGYQIASFQSKPSTSQLYKLAQEVK